MKSLPYQKNWLHSGIKILPYSDYIKFTADTKCNETTGMKKWELSLPTPW